MFNEAELELLTIGIGIGIACVIFWLISGLIAMALKLIFSIADFIFDRFNSRADADGELEWYQLVEAIVKSWDQLTCHPKVRAKWSSDNPALGQDTVTALLIQDYCGGEILYCQHYHHYWNRIDNQEIDLVNHFLFESFTVCPDKITDYCEIVKNDIAAEIRYRLLKQRVERKLGGRKRI